MPATAGKKALFKVATAAGGPYSTVQNIKSVSINIDAPSLDVTQLGNDWIARIQGLRDAKISASGNYDQADTNGQSAILSAHLNDTPLFAQVLPNGVNGFQCQVKVTKFGPGSQTSSEAQVSIELEQTGGITQI